MIHPRIRWAAPLLLAVAALLLSACGTTEVVDTWQSDSVEPEVPEKVAVLVAWPDALQRLVDVWATGEAAASLGFAAARGFDALEPVEARKDEALRAAGVAPGRASFKLLRKTEPTAIECLELRMRAAREAEAGAFERFDGVGEGRCCSGAGDRVDLG